MKRKERRTNEQIEKDLLEYFADQDFGVTTEQVARDNGLHNRSAARFLDKLLEEGEVFYKKVGRQNQWALMEYYKPWKRMLARREKLKSG